MQQNAHSDCEVRSGSKRLRRRPAAMHYHTHVKQVIAEVRAVLITGGGWVWYGVLWTFFSNFFPEKFGR